MTLFGIILFTLVSASALLCKVNGHGRLMDPPSRSSMWRIPEFQQMGVKTNYNDNELFCGGFEVQYNVNGGECGVCGDAFHLQRPRDNENGGIYGMGIISRQYIQGQAIQVDVELTANHLGYFEFRLCKLENSTEYEDSGCFDDNLLELAQGGTKFFVATQSSHYYPQVLLPTGLTCDHCVFQWHYRTGNNWGTCEDGTGAVGCGPQETFRGCADIAIKSVAQD